MTVMFFLSWTVLIFLLGMWCTGPLFRDWYERHARELAEREAKIGVVVSRIEKLVIPVLKKLQEHQQ